MCDHTRRQSVFDGETSLERFDRQNRYANIKDHESHARVRRDIEQRQSPSYDYGYIDHRRI